MVATTHVEALIIDDDVDECELISERLRKEGYSSAIAHNGKQGLELLDAIRPDLILVDLFMPEMDGLRFREAQRRNRELLKIPTVVMTASDEEMMLDLAVEETLRKPVRTEQLLEIVRRHCGPR